jgi:hypothetical protein
MFFPGMQEEAVAKVNVALKAAIDQHAHRIM